MKTHKKATVEIFNILPKETTGRFTWTSEKVLGSSGYSQKSRGDTAAGEVNPSLVMDL